MAYLGDPAHYGGGGGAPRGPHYIVQLFTEAGESVCADAHGAFQLTPNTTYRVEVRYSPQYLAQLAIEAAQRDPNFQPDSPLTFYPSVSVAPWLACDRATLHATARDVVSASPVLEDDRTPSHTSLDGRSMNIRHDIAQGDERTSGATFFLRTHQPPAGAETAVDYHLSFYQPKGSGVQGLAERFSMRLFRFVCG